VSREGVAVALAAAFALAAAPSPASADAATGRTKAQMCTTCHGAGTLSLSLGGPHGMHVVADSRWRTESGHGSLAKQNRQACAACHGADFRGSVLSRTAAARDWGNRTVTKGAQVGCYDCHNGPNGGD